MNMSEKHQITIEIDGESYQAPAGAMLIEVADAHGIEIPRFCYHKKLSVAANCRMCLVEVARAPKPLPACATPVQDGMKVWTRSPLALSAQQAMMEFLLINHPLDCPICDQGGECELQDVAMGFGRDVSQYVEAKRVVPDPDLGPLVATDMTRCIQCTRCVRFGEEIAGLRELGAIGRGEFMRITTYVQHALESELSGNIIDLCPVGALTAKPSRYAGRAWEMIQHSSLAAHDCVGSNLYAHTLRGKVIRVVPRDNESINETWISDRDRFSYQGLYAEDRLQSPMVKRDGRWETVEWEKALVDLAGNLKRRSAEQVAALISPSVTIEEHYLFQKCLRGAGVRNIDHRLHQLDFSMSQEDPLFPWLGQTIESLESNDTVLLVGANPRKDQPILGHRLRKAVIGGARVMDINPLAFDFNYPVAERMIVPPQKIGGALADVLAAVCDQQESARPDWLGDRVPTETAANMARMLAEGRQTSIFLGPLAMSHPEAAKLRVLAYEIARLTQARFGYLPEGANSAGAWIAGAVPHRGAAGKPLAEPGLDVAGMIDNPHSAYLLYGIDAEYDCASPAPMLNALRQADFVAVFATHATPQAMEYADMLLPIATPFETSGTLVNAEGRWQSFSGVTTAPGEARPGWKVLRVLGNMLDLAGFDYMSSEEIREEIKSALSPHLSFDNSLQTPTNLSLNWMHGDQPLLRWGTHEIYAVDPLVRRSKALQETPEGKRCGVWLNTKECVRLGVENTSRIKVFQGDYSAVFDLHVDDRLADGVAWIPLGIKGGEGLAESCAPIHIEVWEGDQ